MIAAAARARVDLGWLSTVAAFAAIASRQRFVARGDRAGERDDGDLLGGETRRTGFAQHRIEVEAQILGVVGKRALIFRDSYGNSSEKESGPAKPGLYLLAV